MLSSTVYSWFFYGLAIVSIIFAIFAVTTRKLLRAVVYLSLVLVTSAGFYLLLNFEFLAGIQILVYVGGIVVLLVFAVMLVSSIELLEERPRFYRRVIGFLVSALFFTVTMAAFMLTRFNLSGPVGEVDEVREIGTQLLSYSGDGFVLPFEIVSLLLLAAVIGGVVVARKIPWKVKSQARVGE
ncbi:NADH-quinone oxidoreductase subunit J [Bdellovibrionota bacterium]